MEVRQGATGPRYSRGNSCLGAIIPWRCDNKMSGFAVLTSQTPRFSRIWDSDMWVACLHVLVLKAPNSAIQSNIPLRRQAKVCRCSLTFFLVHWWGSSPTWFIWPRSARTLLQRECRRVSNRSRPFHEFRVPFYFDSFWWSCFFNL